MVVIHIQTNSSISYSEARDAVCNCLVGNRAFRENDIIVTDAEQDTGTICIVLGDSPLELNIYTNIDHFETVIGSKHITGLPDQGIYDFYHNSLGSIEND